MRGHTPEEMRRRLTELLQNVRGHALKPARRMARPANLPSEATIVPFPARRPSLRALVPSLSTED